MKPLRTLLTTVVVLILVVSVAVVGGYLFTRDALQRREDQQSALNARMDELRARQPSKLDDLMRTALPTSGDQEALAESEATKDSAAPVFAVPVGLSSELSDSDLQQFILNLEKSISTGGKEFKAIDLFDSAALVAIALSTREPAPELLRSYQREFGDERLSAPWSLLPPWFPGTSLEYGPQTAPKFIKKVQINNCDWAVFRRVAYDLPSDWGVLDIDSNGQKALDDKSISPADEQWIGSTGFVIRRGIAAKYCAVRLHRNADGDVRVVDWYDLQRGWPQSQLLRDEFAREYFGKLPMHEFRVDSAMETERVLTIAYDAEKRNEIAYAFELLESLKSVRRVDVQQLRLAFLAKHNRGELPAAVRELRSQLPYPLVADIMLRTLGHINGLTVTKATAIEQIRLQLSPDPYWQVLDAQRQLNEGNLDAAAAAVPLILKDDPTLWFVAVLRLPAALRDKDHKTAAAIFERMSKRLLVDPKNLEQSKTAKDLVASAEYAAIKSTLKERFERKINQRLKDQQERANALPSAINFRSN